MAAASPGRPESGARPAKGQPPSRPGEAEEASRGLHLERRHAKNTEIEPWFGEEVRLSTLEDKREEEERERRRGTCRAPPLPALPTSMRPPGARTPSGVGLGWPSQVPDARRGSSSAASTLPSYIPQLLPGQVGRLALESAKLAPKKFVHDVS